MPTDIPKTEDFRTSSALSYLQDMLIQEIKNTKNDPAKSAALLAKINMTSHAGLKQVDDHYVRLRTESAKRATQDQVDALNHYILMPGLGAGAVAGKIAQTICQQPKFSQTWKGAGHLAGIASDGIFQIAKETAHNRFQGIQTEGRSAQTAAEESRQQMAGKASQNSQNAKEDAEEVKRLADQEFQMMMKIMGG